MQRQAAPQQLQLALLSAQRELERCEPLLARRPVQLRLVGHGSPQRLNLTQAVLQAGAARAQASGQDHGEEVERPGQVVEDVLAVFSIHTSQTIFNDVAKLVSKCWVISDNCWVCCCKEM